MGNMNAFAKRIMLIVALGVAIIIAVILFYLSEYGLSSSIYQISTEKNSSSIRIVHLTDLHNSEFGKGNEKLISLVSDQSPDLILITGDLVDSGEEETDTASDLISRLCEICPVYISYGNQECEHEQVYGSDLTLLYENAGATVLEREYVDISVNGQMIRLGGIYGYCLPSKYLETNEADPEECAFLEDFQDTDLYTILMCHMPVCWLLNDGQEEWSIDCVLSGHVHGGQVIIPFIGGLYAPDFGWFPGKLEGLYYSSDESKVMVLSRGLGSTEVIPRFNNIPEVVVVDLLP